MIAKGKLVTLTTEEALQHKLADFRADTLDALPKVLNLSDAEIHHSSETWAESLVRVLTYPVVSSILIAVGMPGIIVVGQRWVG
ncbi:MAG: hypothetical protein AB7P24_11830 [Nitrospira sp.]